MHKAYLLSYKTASKGRQTTEDLTMAMAVELHSNQRVVQRVLKHRTLYAKLCNKK
jgi:hypothetical protein